MVGMNLYIFLEFCVNVQFSHLLAVYYTLVADLAIGPASNWLFILNWWLVVPLARPKSAAKFDIGW